MSYTKHLRLLSCEEFEAKLCLSAVPFVSHDVFASEASGAEEVYAADMDGDGDADILSVSTGKIAWYENIDGEGEFGPQRVAVEESRVHSIFPVDVDGDGDMDIVSASARDQLQIVWYENVDGTGTFGEQQMIDTLTGNTWWHISVHATDLDGDGDVDVLSSSAADDIVAWYENTDGNGTFGTPRGINATAFKGVQLHKASVFAKDVDGDGDMDVLSTTNLENKIVWYENTDAKGTFGEQQVITSFADDPRSVYAEDLDGDGDVDVLSASYSYINANIAWYENIDGNGTFGRQQVISTSAHGANSVYAAGLDGDGDVDVLSASASGPFGFSRDDRISWYENLDGNGTFGRHQVVSSSVIGASSVYVADLDGDGDMDALSASSWDDKIAWYQNIDANGTFGEQQVIVRTVSGAESVSSADLDGDGDVDVLSASSWDDKVAWYENTDGKGTIGQQQVITTEADGAHVVYAADFDGDGDMDALSASSWDDIAWYENVDGNGTFGEPQFITTAARDVRLAFAADIDSDGDLDVLSVHHNSIVWYENANGNGTFDNQQVITTAANNVRSAFAADIDSDGDLDVLSASFDDNKIAWYENIDATGTFGPQQVITARARQAVSVFAADVDNDGDDDVLSASYDNGEIILYENTDGKGNFGKQQIITRTTKGSIVVYAVDLDGDGDVDVLSASSGDDKIAWYENTDGKGTFGEQQFIAAVEGWAFSLHTADVDGDGDLDVLSASLVDDRVAWHEQLRRQVAAGDTSRDFQFNEDDIVQVLQAAKYLSGEFATFEEGDWNTDGVFDQLDIVAALQTGNYLRGPYAGSTRDAVFAEMER